MTFGELLRRHRLAAGIAQETLAERARLSVETISALERGARQKPYLDTIALLAGALGLPPDDRAQLERAASRRSELREAPTNNLPAQISSFVGREHDVATAARILSDHRLLTLAGPGGVGKTRLALRVAAELENTKRDGIWFVDLAPIGNASRLASAIATAIGLPQRPTFDSLVDSLRSKVLFLILDNCEHLIGDVARAVDTILRSGPNVTILATSREPLSIEGERVYRVPPLELNDAIQLFAERAQAADNGFELTDSSGQTVATICRRLDGIALAIEIAAARTGVVSLEIVAAELDEHLHSDAGRIRTPISRQRTMEALFDWSYGLLDDRERFVFGRLSMFVSGFSHELAVAACSTPELSQVSVSDALASLVTKSLVQSETRRPVARYRLLEPARLYAREKMRERGEEQAAARAHALALLALGERFDSALEVTSDRVWEAVVQPERENFRAAAEWGLGQDGDVGISQRLIGSITAMWYGVMSGEAQRAMLQSALSSCNATTPQRVRARLELAEARFTAEFAADGRDALAIAERAVRSQPPEYVRGVASAHYLLGLALNRCGRFTESEVAFREALAKARSVGSQSTIAAATASLGVARLMAGDLNEARVLVREALQFYREAECERLGAVTAAHLAEIEFAAGQTEEALALSRDAAHFYRKDRNWWLLAFVLANQSAYSVALGRYALARSDAREALLLASRIGLRRSASWALQHLAAVAGLRNQANADRRDVERSAQLLGFVDQAYSSAGVVRERTEQQEYEKLLVILRQALGENTLAELMREGATWTEGRAVAEGLEI